MPAAMHATNSAAGRRGSRCQRSRGRDRDRPVPSRRRTGRSADQAGGRWTSRPADGRVRPIGALRAPGPQCGRRKRRPRPRRRSRSEPRVPGAARSRPRPRADRSCPIGTSQAEQEPDEEGGASPWAASSEGVATTRRSRSARHEASSHVERTRRNRANPQTPCPLVQPLARRVPNPTRSPPATSVATFASITGVDGSETGSARRNGAAIRPRIASARHRHSPAPPADHPSPSRPEAPRMRPFSRMSHAAASPIKMPPAKSRDRA